MDKSCAFCWNLAWIEFFLLKFLQLENSSKQKGNELNQNKNTSKSILKEIKIKIYNIIYFIPKEFSRRILASFEFRCKMVSLVEQLLEAQLVEQSLELSEPHWSAQLTVVPTSMEG